MAIPSLVIIGNHTQGLGIIRSAADVKIPIIVVNDLIFSTSRYSKYLTSYKRVSKGTIKSLADNFENEELLNTLLELPVDYPSILMGINEDVIKFISVNRKKLSGKYCIPDNSYQLIFDKYDFNNLLPDDNKLETYLLKDFDPEKLKYSKNYIVKSRTGNKLRNLTGEKAIELNHKQNFLEDLVNKGFSSEEIIIQELITSENPVKSSCAFSVDGEILGLFQYEKVRQHPNQFGTGTYLKSIYDDKILNIAAGILSKLKYTGISEIEFILDPKNGNYKVIEMNPRTWKSINFSTQCNQNLVEKYIFYIYGKEVKKSLSFEKGKFWVDLFTDIPQMFREKRLFSYNIKNLYECTWDSRDPYPFLMNLLSSPFILLRI